MVTFCAWRFQPSSSPLEGCANGVRTSATRRSTYFMPSILLPVRKLQGEGVGAAFGQRELGGPIAKLLEERRIVPLAVFDGVERNRAIRAARHFAERELP